MAGPAKPMHALWVSNRLTSYGFCRAKSLRHWRCSQIGGHAHGMSSCDMRPIQAVENKSDATPPAARRSPLRSPFAPKSTVSSLRFCNRPRPNQGISTPRSRGRRPVARRPSPPRRLPSRRSSPPREAAVPRCSSRRARRAREAFRWPVAEPALRSGNRTSF